MNYCAYSCALINIEVFIVLCIIKKAKRKPYSESKVDITFFLDKKTVSTNQNNFPKYSMYFGI